MWNRATIARRRAARKRRRRQRLAAIVFLAGAVVMLGVFVLPAHGARDAATDPVAATRLLADLRPLTTFALHDVTADQGGRATLSYRVEGAIGDSASVAIAITDKNGKRAKSWVLPGYQPSGVNRSVSFRCNLKPGTYTWTVYATDRLPRYQTTAGSASLRVRALVPAAAAIARAIAWLEARAGVQGFAVVDSRGVLHGWNQDRQFVCASVVKAMLLVQYLRTHSSVDSGIYATLHSMITVSDNNAAEAIYSLVGGDAGLYAVAGAAGMRHFAGAGYLFGAQITAADQARFFYRLPSLVPKANRALALSLLSHIVSYQSWGVPAAARPLGWTVWFKGGWRGTDLGQLVHQVARLRKDGRVIAICVLTDGDPSWATAKRRSRA